MPARWIPSLSSTKSLVGHLFALQALQNCDKSLRAWMFHQVGGRALKALALLKTTRLLLGWVFNRRTKLSSVCAREVVLRRKNMRVPNN